MKAKKITTDKATLLVVEVLPKIKPETIKVVEGMMYYRDHIGIDGVAVPKGNWQLLGRLPDITEGDLYTLGFRADNLSSILDKLEHLIIKNNIYFKNIYGETKPLPPWQDLIESEGLHVNYKHRLKLWSEAQSKVWDKERTYLLIKVD